MPLAETKMSEITVGGFGGAQLECARISSPHYVDASLTLPSVFRS
ncbi:hypothetical protein FPSE_08909 [Fusarium pseudograminearum CS3096]|uniref:Uncharacterized protein n=1 Tax=Fusarium pseudograminearum (strain CS3096) TaxID=1028729 RepID=K3UGK3_FUSPC|nr:hypothetical protein FPSE_08909 [Fusarium pseudograminearum CS3096]EKJ70941.1 hypothetical protein FPSE_08909 [Fusarium pseudograminearum CS3096]